jgi:hypothetical protein
MALSSDLIAKFAKAVRNSKSKEKKEDYAYGTVVLNAKGETCIKLDGSDVFTPISSTADLLPGDRAMVLIKNHNVVVTGNMTSPAARNEYVRNIDNRTSSNAIINLVYPVGSIYMSVNDVSPEVIFGGVWEQIKDRFLLASGDIYENGTIGGNESHAHSLSNGYAKISVTSQGNIISKDKSVKWTTNRSTTGELTTVDDEINATVATELGGNTNNVSNMPPYLAVYIWQRIG